MTRVATLLSLVLVVAACGGDGGSGTTTVTTPTTTPVTTTIAPPETSSSVVPPITAASTTTTAPTTTTSLVITFAVNDGVPPVFGPAGDPHGSGCAPPSGDVLPDGVWFGYAMAFGGFQAGSGSEPLSFDLACYFTGDAAYAARVADGLPGDSDASEYVRNKNPKLYTVPFWASAEVWSIPSGSGFPQLIPAGSWPRSDGYFACPGAGCPVWLYVNGGMITGLVEQYFE